MPRHATSTSFKKGYIVPDEVIAKRQHTFALMRENGWRSLPIGYKCSPENIEKRNATRRKNALGNTHIVERDGVLYRQIFTASGVRYEHRFIMEYFLGRPLLRSEHVHHINGDGLDNNLDNLCLLTASEHSTIHHSLPKDKWARSYDECKNCGTNEKRHVGHGLCTTCYQRALIQPLRGYNYAV